ncbi:hypothetical protein GCM10010912_08300 [Paenibacillus albidus]|uniref:HTH araC/xylS-type domain-containing protein n=1 Tax=Paenibacillus albidus TaxID=2041023 RepID=A0A917BZX7_9BACL|nr:helix-turn-helix domain-containing protein [Paenibacillus albidus]GGF65600.1 hypothetical protein GCM10010912_08300 [Paenibacillus albidus]
MDMAEAVRGILTAQSGANSVVFKLKAYIADRLNEELTREQLIATNKSISEVADGLGYGNFSYFARLFRKVHGVTPHDYRKNVRSRA